MILYKNEQYFNTIQPKPYPPIGLFYTTFNVQATFLMQYNATINYSQTWVSIRTVF